LPVPAAVLPALSHDRWPVAPLPVAATQMRGAARAFVHAPDTCPRLPALALPTGFLALPTGFWDRRPQPTPGRLRRALAHCPCPQDFPLPTRIRAQAAITAHLPTGCGGQRNGAAPPPHQRSPWHLHIRPCFLR